MNDFGADIYRTGELITPCGVSLEPPRGPHCDPRGSLWPIFGGMFEQNRVYEMRAQDGRTGRFLVERIEGPPIREEVVFEFIGDFPVAD